MDALRRRLGLPPPFGGQRQIGAPAKPLRRNPFDMPVAYQQNFCHWRSFLLLGDFSALRPIAISDCMHDLVLLHLQQIYS
jgi:hypothetical protein